MTRSYFLFDIMPFEAYACLSCYGTVLLVILFLFLFIGMELSVLGVLVFIYAW